MPTAMETVSFDIERYKSHRKQNVWFRNRAGATTDQTTAGRICLTCRNLEKCVSTFGWNLITSSQKGCSICNMLLNTVEHFKLMDGLLGMAQLPPLSHQQAGLWRASDFDLWDSLNEGCGRYFYGSTLCCCLVDENCVEVKIRVVRGTNAGVPKLTQFYLESLNRVRSNKVQLYLQPGSMSALDLGIYPEIPRHAGSEVCYETVKSWIEDCDSKHIYCQKPPPGPLPTRVLDVSGGQVKLYESSNDLGMYLALSHCWGDSLNRTITTASNLAHHKKSMEWNAINRTYQDAIALTRKLGYQYIWIDSLCIVQDDAKDWEAESGAMASIYEGAYLTICATHSKDGNGGLFNDRHLSSDLTTDLSLFEPWLADEEKGIYARLFDGRHLRGMNLSSTEPAPLLSRAWAFQERALAPRTVDYMLNEIIWDCRTKRMCECMETDRGNHTLETRKFNFGQSMSSRTEITPTMGVSKPWELAILTYSDLTLTFESDKLPALSGLAQRMFRSKQSRYLCGLWECDLPLSLLWYVGKGVFNEWNTEKILDNISMPGIRPCQYRAPTWSWASIDGKIYHHRPSKPILSLSSVVSVVCTPEGSDPFGRCIDGTLEIRGPIFDRYSDVLGYRLRFDKYYSPDEFSVADEIYIFLDTRPSPSRKLVKCLVLAQTEDAVYGLVLQKLSDEEVYSRVGIFLSRIDNSLVSRLLEGLIETVAII